MDYAYIKDNMKIRDNYPIYINPDFNEVVEMARLGWDTMRIMQSQEYLVIGSGYGNTHNSLMQAAKALLKPREYHQLDPLIMYHEDGVVWFNCEDVSGNAKTPLRKMARELTLEQMTTIRELIKESGLTWQ